MVKVTRRGQVTIPKALRDATGIGPGSDVAFECIGEAIVLRQVRPGSGARLAARLVGRGDIDISTDEVMSLTRRG